MQPKFVRRTNPNDKLQELSKGYDKLIRIVFRILTLDRPPKEKLELLKEEYSKICDIHIEKNEVLITRLQKLKEEIKMSRPNLNSSFTEAMRLLRSAEIIDILTYKQLIDAPALEDHVEPNLNYAINKENAKSANKFLFGLINKKLDSKKRKEKDATVDWIIEKLRKIDFEELDAKLEIGFEQYGSTVNGYSLQNSDYDVSLTTLEPVDERKVLEFFYGKARTILKEFVGKDKFRITKITHENIRIPIVVINILQGNLDLSFSVNNTLGVYNSNLIKAYAKFDHRCQMLGLLVKIWANTHKVISAQKNFLSSYAFNLMVINFLQTIKDPILPNLQEMSKKESVLKVCRKINNGQVDEFDTRVDFENDAQVLESLKQKYSANKLTDIELLQKFFEFYSQDKTFSTSRLSVKNGKQVPRSENGDEMTYLYSIEDPFDSKHNPGRSLKMKSSQATKFLEIMKKSCVLLKGNKYQEVFQPFI